jgi:hypothetical protein
MLSSFQGRFAFGKAAPSGPPAPTAPSNSFMLFSPPNGSNNMSISANNSGGYPADNDRVGWWRDDSSNGYHAEPAGGTLQRRPRYETSVMTVNGSSVDSAYFASDVESPYTSGMYFGTYAPSSYVGFTSGAATLCFDFQLTELPGSGTEFMLLAKLVGQSGGNYYVTDIYASNYSGYTSLCWRFVYSAGATNPGVGYAATLDTNRHRLIVTYDGVDSSSATSYTVRLDGSNVTPTVTGNFGTSATYSTLGADYGSNYGNFRGYIRSFAAYNRALSTAECEQWEEWVGPDL